MTPGTLTYDFDLLPGSVIQVVGLKLRLEQGPFFEHALQQQGKFMKDRQLSTASWPPGFFQDLTEVEIVRDTATGAIFNLKFAS